MLGETALTRSRLLSAPRSYGILKIVFAFAISQYPNVEIGNENYVH